MALATPHTLVSMTAAMKRPPQSSTSSKDITFDLTDPRSYRPQAMARHASELWPLAAMQGWMTKHMPPAFSFTKTRKRRYVLLIDRMLYTFKTDRTTHDYKEYYELTRNTNVFATDQFPGVLYCLEIQRTEDGRTWYLQADDAEAMKLWLSVIKKTVQWLKKSHPYSNETVVVINNNDDDVNEKIRRVSTISSSATSSGEEDHHHRYHQLSPPSCIFNEYWAQESVSYLEYISSSPSAMDEPPPASNNNNHDHLHRRRPSRLPSVLPPQLPPPTSSLPPLPPQAVTPKCTYY